MDRLCDEEAERLGESPKLMAYIEALLRLNYNHPKVRANLRAMKRGVPMESWQSDPKIRTMWFNYTQGDDVKEKALDNATAGYVFFRKDWLLHGENSTLQQDKANLDYSANLLKTVMGPHRAVQFTRELDRAVDAVIEPQLLARGYTTVEPPCR